MRVALLHYHLRPGGVTRVIEMAEQALQDAGCEVLVISGEPAPPGCRVERAAVVPSLAYGSAAEDFERLRDGVREAAIARWGKPADVIHTHNHSLGKSAALPAACAAWARDGQPLITQMHDFAENGRPANYRFLLDALGGGAGLAKTLHPCGGNTIPAVLGSAAAARWARAGGRAAIVPNPVVVPPVNKCVGPADFDAESLVLYPSRGIGRKNLGEVLLHAAGAQKGEVFAISSRPARGADSLAYSEWERVATQLGLPVLFDAAGRADAGVYECLAGADLCLTTSVEEGFGMAFLEPWAVGKGLVGRDLPSVTDDFRTVGLALGGLYSSIPVELDADQSGRLCEEVLRLVDAALADYERPPDARATAAAMGAVRPDDCADFGRLPPSLQVEVLKRGAAGRPEPGLLVAPDGATICANRALVGCSHAPGPVAKKLVDLYQTALEATERPVFLDPVRVLDAFLDFSDFAACRDPRASRPVLAMGSRRG